MAKYISRHTGREIDDAIDKIQTLTNLTGSEAIQVDEVKHQVKLVLDRDSGLAQSENGLTINSEITFVLDCDGSDEI